IADADFDLTGQIVDVAGDFKLCLAATNTNTANFGIEWKTRSEGYLSCFALSACPGFPACLKSQKAPANRDSAALRESQGIVHHAEVPLLVAHSHVSDLHIVPSRRKLRREGDSIVR